MRTAVPFAILASVIIVITGPANAANVQHTATAPTVELSITEEVRGKPDVATFNTGVNTRAMTAKEALRQNSEQVANLIARIKKAGIAAKDIQTSGININQAYDYRDNVQKFIGYDVSNNVTVKIRDIDRIGEIIDAMVDASATNLSGPYFSIENDDALKMTARERALERANTMATFYARKAGYSGVRMITVSESLSGTTPMPMPVMMTARMDSAAASKAPVEPGEVGVAVNIAVTYEMTR